MSASKPSILVTGGAGFIGSHMVKLLDRRGYGVVTLDNFSTGYRDAVRHGRCEEASVADVAAVQRVLEQQRIAAVMHFAAFSLVGESFQKPEDYRRNNVEGSRALLAGMRAAGVRQLIFSSTAAVYGQPETALIREDHPLRPINPYGETKLAVERMLAEAGAAGELAAVSLRYFNAAGADPEGELGERHEPETHLIPLVLRAASGRLPQIGIQGTDFPTVDGTAVRDYIHVQDLCEAHLLALEHLLAGGGSRVYNLGNGAGFSVREVINTARRVTGREIPAVEGPRRSAGEPAVLVADAARIRAELGWQPQYHRLDDIVAHAWRWELGQAARV